MIPGQVAALLQVYRGTKHRRFPNFLDAWLKCRKQLGLLSFSLGVLHAVISVAILSPDYMGYFYHKPTVTMPAMYQSSNLTTSFYSIPSELFNPAGNVSEAYVTKPSVNPSLVVPLQKTRMNWSGETATLIGLLALLVMAVLAVTSIPSVSEAMNWAEWTFVQSKLGYFTVFLSVAHVCVMARLWLKYPFFSGELWTKRKWLSCVLPILVLILKLLFSIPPLGTMLWKIRREWERGGARSYNSVVKQDSSFANGDAVVDIENETSLELLSK